MGGAGAGDEEFLGDVKFQGLRDKADSHPAAAAPISYTLTLALNMRNFVCHEKESKIIYKTSTTPDLPRVDFNY